MKRPGAILFFFFALCGSAASSALPQGSSLSGYLKSLNFASYDRDPSRVRGLSGNRLRLDGEWQDRRQILDLRVIADHEFLYGALLSSQRAALDSILARNELLDLEWTLNEQEDVLWRENLYRAYAAVHAGGFDATVGRQRVAWGQGRLWNPTDTINPYNPLSVEREERPGSDAVRVQWNADALSFLEGVYVPRQDGVWDRSFLMGRARANFRGMDWGLMGGKKEDERIVGLDHASQVLEGSLRGEFAATFGSRERRDFSRAVASYDYSFDFSRPVYALGEFFYNGIGEKNKEDYGKVLLKAGDQPFVGRDYFGFGSNIELTPLWKAECTGILNLDDASLFLGPVLRWQPATDLELAAGYQAFIGSEASEFGRLKDVGFLQVQWFFAER